MGSSGDGGSMANYQINLGEDLTINATLKTFENQLHQYRESSEQIKLLMEQIQQFKKDKQRLQDNMAHCLFCIYNQQDISHYFSEMMFITELMKQHYNSTEIPGLKVGQTYGVTA